MLVLSRRVDDRIVFPNVGIKLQILRVKGSNVRIGIEAPPDVRVVRQELCDSEELQPESPGDRAAAQWQHRLRNGLNAAKLGFHLAMRQLDVGQASNARATLERSLSEIEDCERRLVAAKTGAASPITTGATPDARRRRALVVEDNPNECELLAGYLRASGYEVETARDGLEAMSRLAAKHDRPQVVLLDMRMPRLDGPKTVSAIRANPDYQGLKVYAVSGVSHREANVSVGPRGVDRWFLKPINPAELVHELDRELTCEAISA